MLNSARQVGGMLGVAVFGFFVHDIRPEAFMRGMHLSIMSAAALLFCGGVMCLYGIRTPRPAYLENTPEALASDR
jgi:DHA2 family methylenomycin A resistance protein-like MFS transporter